MSMSEYQAKSSGMRVPISSSTTSASERFWKQCPSSSPALNPAASPAVVPPGFFREFLAPRLGRVLAALRGGGAAFTWLNIAGPTAGILDCYAHIGADVATFDYYLSAAEASRLLPRTCLAGNLKSLDFLDAAPDVVKREARGLVAAFGGRGGFLLSSGCEIPPEAAAGNIAAMAAALNED